MPTLGKTSFYPFSLIGRVFFIFQQKIYGPTPSEKDIYSRADTMNINTNKRSKAFPECEITELFHR